MDADREMVTPNDPIERRIRDALSKAVVACFTAKSPEARARAYNNEARIRRELDWYLKKENKF